MEGYDICTRSSASVTGKDRCLNRMLQVSQETPEKVQYFDKRLVFWAYQITASHMVPIYLGC